MHRAQMRTAQMNNRRIKDGFNRQRNDIQFSNASKRDQQKYPTRKTRMGGNRQRNNHGLGRQFELNRNRASGVRQRIQFNNTNNVHSNQFNGRNPSRVGRQRQRLNYPRHLTTTISPTTWPSTTWIAPTTIKPTPMAKATTTTETITRVPPNVISNDVNHYDDNNQSHHQIEESERLRQEETERHRQEETERLRQEETERHRQEENIRKKEAEHQWRMEQERLKQMRQHDLEERRQKELIQNERKQQDQREQNDRDRYEYTHAHPHPHANEVLQQPDMQTDRIRQQNERTNDERAVQTNEIFGGTISTTLSPLEKKKLKQKLLRDRISKLSPEEQQYFFQRRAEKRHKKRDN